MLCSALYSIACALILEDGSEAGGISFTEFAPGIINSFLLEYADMARALGSVFDEIPAVSVLTDEFPYSGSLASACVYYLASRLIRDENAAAAEELMARCDRLTAQIGESEEASAGGCDCGGSDGAEEELQVFSGSTIDVYAGVI